MTTRLRIKIGDIEAEAEGEESFIEHHLIPLLQRATALTSGSSPGAHVRERNRDDERREKDDLQLTTSTIAANLGVKSGPELIIAASAQLTFVRGKESFSRQDILMEAKTASAYYNENVAKNLSHHLNSLVKGRRLNELNPGVYALNAATREELKSRIGG